jgi:uncharacterized protein YjbJ (UPF0337 family)
MATSRTRDKVSGAMQYVKGRFKARSANPDTRRSGQKDQVKGGLRNKKGHAKDLAK